MFHRYVASVSCGFCKSRSGYCICCNGCTYMLQASVLNVSSIFFQRYVAYVFIWMLHMFHTYIASVLSGCHVCFTMVFQVFRMYVLNVSSAFTASIVSRCFKYRSSVASPSSLSAASHQFLLLLLKLARHSPPPPLLDASGVRDGAGPA
jgi:hypothetical protein